MVIKSVDKIFFYYKDVGLYDEMRRHSSNVAKTLKIELSAEDFSIMDDDIELYKYYISEAINEVNRLFYKLNLNLQPSVVTNWILPETTSSSLPSHVSGIFLWNKYDVPMSQLVVIDKYIESAIVRHVLSKWWQEKGIKEIYSVLQSELQLAMQNINNSLYPFYRPNRVSDGVYTSIVVIIQDGIESSIIIGGEAPNSVDSDHYRLHDITDPLDHRPVEIKYRDKIVITNPLTGQLDFTDVIDAGEY